MLPYLFEICEKNDIRATFFELTTALAFLKFKQARCEVIVLEVGLGGRLDSTNVVTPSLSVITSVQLDHTKILGDTVDKIAREKGGIIKPYVPVLLGPDSPVQLLEVSFDVSKFMLCLLCIFLNSEVLNAFAGHCSKCWKSVLHSK